MIQLHPPFTIHHYAVLGSTNDQLKAMPDAPEFTCVTADEQTAGRGRRDRSWHSVPGEGLYLSIFLRPEIEADEFPLLSFIAAIAVAETIQPLLEKASIDIKWPNDVLVNERKISGVLIESASINNSAPRVIVGIGVNLNHESFPEELQQTATSLWIESGENFNVEKFRNSLLDRVAYWYEILRSQGGTKILTRWQQLSSYTKGKKITAYLDQEILHGITDGLSAIGALKIITDTGEKREIVAGEITHLRT
jgi:BirA family transcriptional regulator, biotin operon repressor / biotin---[acetyl-CoA-carboxylase] ligase